MNDLIQLISNYNFNDVVFKLTIIVFLFIYGFYLLFMIYENRLKLRNIIISIIAGIIAVYIIKEEYSVIENNLKKLYNIKYTDEKCLYLLNVADNDEKLLNIFKIKCFKKEKK